MSGEFGVGKRRVLIVISVVFVTNLIVIVLSQIYKVLGQSQVIGFILTSILCFCLFRRQYWAKWALIVMLGLNALVVVAGWAVYASRGMGLLAVVFGPFVAAWLFSIWLLSTQKVNEYLSQRGI